MKEKILDFVKRRKRKTKQINVSEVEMTKSDTKNKPIDFFNIITNLPLKGDKKRKLKDNSMKIKRRHTLDNKKNKPSRNRKVSCPIETSFSFVLPHHMVSDKEDLNLRDRIINHTPISEGSLNINYSTLNKHILLPHKYLFITKVYKVLYTIQKYNTNRGLSNIWSKCKKCVEDILLSRVDVSVVERIWYIHGESMLIKKVQVDKEDTFTFKVEWECDKFDKAVWDFYIENKRKDVRVDDDVIDIPRKEISNEDKDGSKKERKEIIKEERKVENITTTKSTSILERIKERERLRKEAFIKEAKSNDNTAFLNRLVMYFKKENKKSIKVQEIVKVFSLYDGMNYIKMVVDSQKDLEIREIFGQDYLVLHNVKKLI